LINFPGKQVIALLQPIIHFDDCCPTLPVTVFLFVSGEKKSLKMTSLTRTRQEDKTNSPDAPHPGLLDVVAKLEDLSEDM
jgi:hypothetical protein